MSSRRDDDDQRPVEKQAASASQAEAGAFSAGAATNTDNGVHYNPEAARAKVRQTVRALTRELAEIWCGGTEAVIPIYGSFQAVMGYQDKPRFHRVLAMRFFALCAPALLIVFGVASFLYTFAFSGEGREMLTNDPMRMNLLSLAGVLLVAGLVWFIQQQQLANETTKFEKSVSDAARKIHDACNNFISANSTIVSTAAARVKGGVSTEAEIRLTKEALIEAQTYWRALERMPHYVRHDWDNHVRDCRDQRELPKNESGRIFSNLALSAALLILAGGGGALYLHGAALAPGMGDWLSLAGGAVGAAALFSLVFTYWQGGNYTRACAYASVHLTEALRTHKKERALDILDIGFERWLALRGGRADGTWDDWRPDYDERKSEELRAQGMDEHEIKLALSADPVLYVGNKNSIRIQILGEDPTIKLIENIPYLLSN